ncbi:hypothetical protein, partial [Huintestinicola sp.]|uniref:hypothetical protein n=1 Tax=Huintestinicola sp. TaxID=2981661 RepID=UPI003D7D6BB2
YAQTNAEIASSKTFHRNVFEGKLSQPLYKGRRSCSPPLEMLSHFSPLAPFLKDKGDFAVCGRRQGGAAPLTPATFEKVDETFTMTLFVQYFFNSTLSTS